MSQYTIPPRRFYSLQDALTLLEDDEQILNNTQEITLYPPTNACGEITDEDSGDEDILSINNLPGSQLLAPVELIVGSIDDDFSSDDDLPLSRFISEKSSEERNSATKTKVKKKKLYDWEKDDLPDNTLLFENLVDENYENMTPLDLFSMFFDNELLELILTETNNYAKQKNLTQIVNMTDLKAFLGVLILSGFVQIPRRRMFWEREKDAHNELVSDAISRDKFEFIFSNFHLVDNKQIDKEDKFAKVRPLFLKLNETFLKYAPHEEMHSIDEAMVPYYGRHGCKQYIHGKPIRYGYKIWVGATRLGYVNWLEPYQGSSTKICKDYAEFGLGASVVLEYADVLRKKWPDTHFHLFFDNFFTSIRLIEQLTEKGLNGTGTVRENRLPGQPLIDNKIMKKNSRGVYDYKKIKDKNILAVKWHDNNMVSFLSNAAGVNPIHRVKRYSRKDRKNIHIEQPHVVKLYNANMGGVDRLDENISLYRVSMRGKKWYFPLIAHSLDLAIHNAWHIHRKNGGEFDLLRFRRSIATTLLIQNKKPKDYRKGNRSLSKSIINDNLRYDRLDHFVIPQEKQTRCGQCHERTTTRCNKCDVGVHVKCFVSFHTKN